jgi:hypothetical protein
MMTLQSLRRRLRSLALACVRVSPLLPCDQCGHWFLRSDERSYVSRSGEFETFCPVCSLFVFEHGEAWAIWNDCQGVFTGDVYDRRGEAAAELMAPHWDGTNSIVVPVSVLRVPKWHEAARHFDERAFEKVAEVDR